MLMALQIGNASEHVQIHEDEVIYGIEQLVLVAEFTQQIAGKGCKIEQHLQGEDDVVEPSCAKGYENGVDDEQRHHRERRETPAEYAVTDVLEGYEGLTEGVEHLPEPPDALQSSGSDTALALRLLMDVGRTVFQCIGLRCVGDTTAFVDDEHRHHEVVE